MHPSLQAKLKPLTLAIAGTVAAASAGAVTGPSTTAAPYVVPTPGSPVTTITSILTVGDEIGGYKMVGIPDGLGAYDNGDGETLAVLMNHELSATRGIPRDHGAIGAFVSRWSIDKETLAVYDGADMVGSPGDLYTWQGTDRAWDDGSTVLNRLCSADLPPISAFFADGDGYEGLIFMNGEEAADEGRGFAWFATGAAAGEAWELPALGKLAWENSIASPYPQSKTIVMGMDDDGREDSQLYVYVGTKLNETANPDAEAVELAGLHNGKVYGVRVKGTSGIQGETREVGFAGADGAGNGKFEMVDLGDVTNKTGTQLEDESEKAGVSAFRRLEDGQWDPEDPEKFWFTTTDGNLPDGKSRLWLLTFDDISRPERGGRIEMVLDGTEGHEMLDNMTVAPSNGKLYLQEDPGGADRLAKIWEFDPTAPVDPGVNPRAIAEFDENLFGPTAPGGPITTNEESSGIIDVTELLDYCPAETTCLLFDAQVHTSSGDDETVELGQLLLMEVPNS